jgi:putative oxidoreductase
VARPLNTTALVVSPERDLQDLHEQPKPVGKLPDFDDQNTSSDGLRLYLHFPENHRGNHRLSLRHAKALRVVWRPRIWRPGIKGSLDQLTARNIPKFIAWLIIIGQSFGSIALMSGFLGRIAAGGLFIIFTGALIVHLPDGWTLNWFGSKKGEGIEYFVLVLLLLVIVLKGSGALSMDLWLTR